MNILIKTGLLLLLTLLMSSCAGHSPYNDPDAQRERAKEAQEEMRRDMSR